jgi:crotonobetainyl-CoA:carnitine CoA-transferase CaiB-like acyl-CoA transferase
MDHLEELEAALNAIFRIRGSADWLERFEAAGFPAGPVQSIQEMHADPQALARRMVVDTEHSKLGPVKTLGLPVKFSETPGEVATAAPVYGEHTRAVLAEHGFGEAEIDALIADGAVIAA